MRAKSIDIFISAISDPNGQKTPTLIINNEKSNKNVIHPLLCWALIVLFCILIGIPVYISRNNVSTIEFVVKELYVVHSFLCIILPIVYFTLRPLHFKNVISELFH